MREAASAADSLKRKLPLFRGTEDEPLGPPGFAPDDGAPVADGAPPAMAEGMGVSDLDGATGVTGEFIAEGGVQSAEGDEEEKSPPTKKRRVSKKRGKNRPWNDMLYELLKFKAKNGHCRVPGSKGSLGSWVVQQRQQYHALKAKQEQEDSKPQAEPETNETDKPQEESKRRSQVLNEERIEVLDTIDFVWDVVQFDNDVRWNQRYEELKEYVRVNGHAIVPQSSPLGQWVKMQRENKKEVSVTSNCRYFFSGYSLRVLFVLTKLPVASHTSRISRLQGCAPSAPNSDRACPRIARRNSKPSASSGKWRNLRSDGKNASNNSSITSASTEIVMFHSHTLPTSLLVAGS